MNDAIYRIVEHDGGWAYKLGDVFSETFANRQAAEAAAKRVAEEQRSPGDDESISWEDERGIWHDEVTRGHDRPNAYVASGEASQQSTTAQRSRSTEHGDVALKTASGHAPADTLVVMLLTIAFAYILGIVVGRKA